MNATDPFGVDEIRSKLAQHGDLEALRASYVAGAFPELTDLSPAHLWDDLASFAEVPDFRLRRLRAVADLIPPGSKVLDVGVGWGEIIPMIQARGGCHYTGIDFSEEIISRAAAKAPGCRFLVGSLEQLGEPFEVTLALEVC